jgi:hypothetical protein
MTNLKEPPMTDEYDLNLERYEFVLKAKKDGQVVKAEYYIQEMTGEEGDQYDSFRFNKRDEADQNKREFIDPTDLEATLLSLCMYVKETNKKVTIEFARGLPKRVSNDLYIKAVEINGLSPKKSEEDTEEQEETGS